MKKTFKIIMLILSTVLIACMLSVPVYANSARMPSFEVTLYNSVNSNCYFTLLSNLSAGERTYADSARVAVQIYMQQSSEVDRKLSEYTIANSVMNYNNWYAHVYSLNSGKIGIYRSYGEFQALVYFPDTDTYITSDIIKPYAIETKYTIKITENGIEIESSFDPVWNIIALAVRIIVTITLELLIALLFRFRSKKQLVPIVFVNLITQAGLNIGMNVFHVFVNDWISLIRYYLLLEAAVFIAEAVIYDVIFKKNDKSISGVKIAVYAYVANFVSFAASPLIAAMMKGTF